MAGHVAHGIHQALGAAAIDVALGLLQRWPEIIGVRHIALVVVDNHLAAKLRPLQLVQKRRHLRVARQVIELERGTAAGEQKTRHREQRGDANSARNERVASGRRRQLEIIGWIGDRQQIARVHVRAHAGRTAPAIGLALDGDHIAVALMGIVAEGVLALLAIGRAQGNMRAGGEGWQIAPGGIAQLEQTHVLRNRFGALNAQISHGVASSCISAAFWVRPPVWLNCLDA